MIPECLIPCALVELIWIYGQPYDLVGSVGYLTRDTTDLVESVQPHTEIDVLSLRMHNGRNMNKLGYPCEDYIRLHFGDRDMRQNYCE